MTIFLIGTLIMLAYVLGRQKAYNLAIHTTMLRTTSYICEGCQAEGPTEDFECACTGFTPPKEKHLKIIK